MDLTWPAELEDYRAELRSWFAHNFTGRTFPKLRRRDTIEPYRAWERTLYDAGLGAVHWPRRYGGQDADPLKAAVFHEEYIRAGAPRRLNRQALGLAGPTIMAAGAPVQQDRWLRNMVSCDEIWCQGFSEPDAGSDLASLRTRAERDGDGYVVNGQKIWSSNAPIADWVFALVRTNTEAPKHRGLSYLMIDLSSPGVEVRPLEQIDGHGDFAELFFADVVVPVENRIGDEDDGWRVAMTTLAIERGAGVANAAEIDEIVRDVEAIMEATGASEDVALQAELVRLKAHVQRYRLNAYASLSSTRPETTSRLGAIHKLSWSTLQVALHELGMRALGDDVELGNAATTDGVAYWHERYWLARASLIYSGTNEIQRNIVAERVLGLPKDFVR
jgi:alkylation response protein AidB-like acyl-CoA dehydrogenase